MKIHEEVLNAARRICKERGNWRFAPEELVRALPHLNVSSVRTHIVSRCCINAPRNHPHKWNYFRRIKRGVYEIAAGYRSEKPERSSKDKVSEIPLEYLPASKPAARESIHAVIHRDPEAYVGECLEIAVVTQGRTIDELVSNLREAITLHLAGEEVESFGLSTTSRLVMTYELPLSL